MTTKVTEIARRHETRFLSPNYGWNPPAFEVAEVSMRWTKFIIIRAVIKGTETKSDQWPTLQY